MSLELPIFENLPPISNTVSYTPPVPSADPEQMKKEAQVATMLGNTFNVTLTDGRVYHGVFSCLDSKGAIILEKAFLQASPKFAREFIGHIIINQKDYVKVEVEAIEP